MNSQDAITGSSNLEKETCYYVGGFKNALFHGYGKLTMPDGTYYEGNWVDGLKHGSGKLERPLKSPKISYNQMLE